VLGRSRPSHRRGHMPRWLSVTRGWPLRRLASVAVHMLAKPEWICQREALHVGARVWRAFVGLHQDACKPRPAVRRADAIEGTVSTACAFLLPGVVLFVHVPGTLDFGKGALGAQAALLRRSLVSAAASAHDLRCIAIDVLQLQRGTAAVRGSQMM